MKILAALLFMPIVATAQVWVPVGRGGSTSVDIDVTSIRPDGKYAKAWVRYTNTDGDLLNQYDPQSRYFMSKYLLLMDCAGGADATKQAAFYKSTEDAAQPFLVQNYPNPSSNFAEPIPGTLASSVLRYVCLGRK